MRIVSGKYRGRVFDPPSGLPIRPTTDRNREALFNILVHRYDIRNTDCLDLFAGAGGITYELLSRGAQSVISVEQHQGCAAFIQQTLDKLGEVNGKIVKEDVFRFLKRCNSEFDLVFADPPYALDGQEGMVATICEKLLKPSGILILEHDTRMNFEDLPGCIDHRDYGKGSFSFFESMKNSPNLD